MASGFGIAAGVEAAQKDQQFYAGILNSRQATSLAWDRWKYAYKRRYRWAVEDLKAAGLNPILAVGGSPGSAPMPPVSGHGPSSGSAAAGANADTRRALVAAEKGLIEAQTAAAGEQARLNANQADWVGRLGPWGRMATRAGEIGEQAFDKMLHSAKLGGGSMSDYLMRALMDSVVGGTAKGESEQAGNHPVIEITPGPRKDYDSKGNPLRKEK